MKNIFISSTFRDMHAERDLVQERVLPVLRAEARKYGDNVEAIDLRWGVDTSTLETDEGSAKVLKVCLDEIDRSHPYMLIFLGERYGWIPKGELIEKAVKSRGDKYITEDFEKSVTALEIEYGALSEKYGDMKHCVVCFRELVTESMDDETKSIYVEQEEKGIQKLRDLKERIRKDLGEHLITYTGTWDKSAHTLTDLRVGRQPLEEVLIRCYIEIFQQDWKDYEQLSWQEKEQLGFKAFMESKLRSFVGREELLDKYYEMAVNGTGALVLQGEVGSGKTSIMCKLVEKLQNEGKKVFYFFSGTGSMSNSAYLLLQQMLYFVEKQLGIEEHWDDNWEKRWEEYWEELKEEEWEELKKEERKRLSKEKENQSVYDICLERLEKLCSRLQEKIYFCIDALDQLTMDEHVEKLDFSIDNKNVQMILSSTDAFMISPMTMLNIQKERIPALTIEDAKAVVRGTFKSNSRDTCDEIEQEILRKKSIGKPLYIFLLVQRLNMMDQDELENLNSAEKINVYSTEVIRNLPEELDEATVVILKDAVDKISQGKKGLQEALNFLAISRNGLRISDLQKLLEIRKADFSVLDFTLFMKYLAGFFYIGESDKIDVTHKVIRQGLLKEIKNRSSYEVEMKEYIKSLDENDSLRIQEGMYYARITKDYEFIRALLVFVGESRFSNSIEPTFYIRMIKNSINEVIEEAETFGCDYIRMMEKHGLNNQKVNLHNLGWWGLKNILENFESSQKNLLIKKSILEAWMPYAHCDVEMGDVLLSLEQVEEALIYYKKELQRVEKEREKIQEREEREIWVTDLGDKRENIESGFQIHGKMGKAFLALERKEEALKEYKEALHYAEEDYNHSRGIRLDFFVSGYGQMGDVFVKLGRIEEALGYYKRSLGIAEELHEHTDKNRDGEISLICYKIGSSYQEQGMDVKAIWYYEKALLSLDKLNKSEKSEMVLDVLCSVYSTMGDIYLSLGQIIEAMVYYEKGLRGRKALYKSQSNEQNLQKLSLSYSKMEKVFQELDKEEHALFYTEKKLLESKELYQEIQGIQSLKENYWKYSRGGDVLLKRGLATEAMSYYVKWLQCIERMHKKIQNEQILQEVFYGHSNIGKVFLEQGELEEAMTYFEKSLDIAGKLHKTQQSNQSILDIALSYKYIGKTFLEQGEPEKAMTYFEKSSFYIKALCEWPEMKQREEAQLLSYCGDVFYEQGELEEAEKHYRKYLVHVKERYEKQNNNDGLQNLLEGYIRIGNVLLEQGQVNDSLVYYRECLNIAEELHERVKNIKSLELLFLSHEKIGQASLEQGETEEALIHFKEGMEFAKELNRRQPNIRSLKNLSLSYMKMGDALLDQGETKEAADYYRKSSNNYRELYYKQQNVCRFNDFILSEEKMGDVFLAEDNVKRALLSYEMCIGDRKEKKTWENNFRSIKEQTRQYIKIGDALLAQDKAEEAMVYYEKAVCYYEKLGNHGQHICSLREQSLCQMKMGDALFAQDKAEEAMVYYEKGVRYYEELDKSQHNNRSLREQSFGYVKIGDALFAQGKAEAALGYYGTAHHYYEIIHENKNQNQSMQELALSNSRVGNILYVLYRKEEALRYYETAHNYYETMYEEALRYYETAHNYYEKRLREKNKNQSVQELALSNNRLGRLLCVLGREEEALKYCERSLEYYEELYEESKDEQGMRYLALSYKCIGNVLFNLGRAEEAVIYYRKSIRKSEELYRKQEKKSGVDGENIQELVISCARMSEILWKQGRAEAALVYYEKSLSYTRQVLCKGEQIVQGPKDILLSYDKGKMVLPEPGWIEGGRIVDERALFYIDKAYSIEKNKQSLTNNGLSYIKMGDILLEQGWSEEAFVLYSKAQGYCEEQYEKQQTNQKLRELAFCHIKRGDALLEQGGGTYDYDYETALEYYEKIHDEQQNIQSYEDMSLCHLKMGDLLLNQGKDEEALTYYEKGLNYAEERYSRQTNIQNFVDLYLCYDCIGNALWNLGRAEEALEYYGKAKNYFERQQSEKVFRELFMIYDHMGNTLLDLGRKAEALWYYEKVKRYCEEQYNKQPTDRNLRDMSLSYNHIGNALLYLGLPEEALKYYEKGLEQYKELYRRQKNNRSARDLSISCACMGDALSKVGLPEEAFKYYEKSWHYLCEVQEIRESDRSLREKSQCWIKMGNLLLEQGENEEAFRYFEQARVQEEWLESRKKRDKRASSEIEEGKEIDLEKLIEGCCVDLCKDLERALVKNDLNRLCEDPKETEVESVLDKLFGDSGEDEVEDSLDIREVEIKQIGPGLDSFYLKQYVSYSKMGDKLSNMGKVKAALGYYISALDFLSYPMENDRDWSGFREIVLIHSKIGKMWFLEENYVESEHYYKKAVDYAEKLYELNFEDENVELYIKVLQEYIDCLLKLERTEEAEEYAALIHELEGRM